MFLDCATLFYGESLRDAKLRWSIATGGLEDGLWQHLLDLSLVWESSGWDGVACGMHEQLLSLGRKIASTDTENGRRMWDTPRRVFLWLSAKHCSENDVKEPGFTPGATGDRTVPEHSTAENSTKAVHRGVTCDKCSIKPIEGPRFQFMVNLDWNLCVGCFKKGGHSNDEYFHIDGLPLPPLEGSILCKMRKLRYLKMSHLDIHGARLPSTLISLRMNGVHFTDFPFSPSDHERMAVLAIRYCHNLRTLPSDFGRLSSLQELDILGARDLKTLPDSLGSLRKLAKLSVSWCNSLEELPQTFGQLVSLETLTIDFCAALSALPESLGYLPKLKDLTIRGCRRLHNLPDTFVELPGLEKLNLWMTYLQSFPSLENLRSLKNLRVLQYDPLIEINSLADFSHWKAKNEACEVEEGSGHGES